MQENTSDSRNNSPPRMIFDPFAIEPEHHEHSGSTSIIELEESGKVFCPLCLEKKSPEDLEKTNQNLFNLYIFNLFEALDQHSENSQLRRIVLPLLDILLKKRSISLKSDLEFHNLLRTIYKVMKSDQFTCNEFDYIAKIFSNISSYFIDSNPLPLVSVWKASENLLSQATKKLRPKEDNSEEPEPMSFNLFGSLALIIKTYLMLLRRFTADQVSDLIFPIYENDTVMKHNRSYYIPSQLDCLRFMDCNLISECWPFLRETDRALESQEKFMASELFDSLKECFKSSIRLNNEKFLARIMDLDSIHIGHLLISKNQDLGFRTTIRSYLREFVCHYIEKYFGSDGALENLASHKEVVEANHKNAIVFSHDSTKYQRTIFYLMANAVASKHNSKYFNPQRVKKVLKSVQPENLDLRISDVFMRTYCYVAAKVITKFSKYETINNFMTRTWDRLEILDDRVSSREVFCHDGTILFWVYEDPGFQKLVTIETIKYLVEQSIKNGDLEKNVNVLLGNDFYRPILQVYLRDEEPYPMINEILLADRSDSPRSKDHCSVVNKLSAILPALLHDAILDSNSQAEASIDLLKTKKLIDVNVAMIKSCNHFDIFLDEQFIIDIFRLIERMYRDEPENSEGLLIVFNEFITLIITTNNDALMRVIKYLNFNTLGYMFHHLNNYTKPNELVESIAQLLLAYDNLDYPLANDLVNDLYPIPLTVVSWMLSQCRELQQLAIRFMLKALGAEIANSTKACITTGLAHMLFKNPSLFRPKLYRGTISAISNYECFKYNPLVYHIIHKLPEPLQQDLSKSSQDSVQILSSPNMSFDSSEDDIFGEEQISVSRILTQLNEEDRLDSSCRIPDVLFVSKAVEDQHSSSFDIDDWSRRAYSST